MTSSRGATHDEGDKAGLPVSGIAQPEPSRSVATTWTYTLGSIVFIMIVLYAPLLFFAAESYNSSRALVDAAVLLLMFVSAAAQLRYCWFLRVGRGGALPRPAWTVALLAPATMTWVVGLLATGADLRTVLPLWMALCLIACLLPRGQRGALLVAGLALVLLQAVLVELPSSQGDESLFADTFRVLFLYGIFLPALLFLSLWWWEIVVEIDRHRQASAALAVTEERLRFAADLHDIQGHHLQVIALKAELAERLFDVDPDTARASIHESRLIAKQALKETRLLVSGYREVTVEDEIDNAKEVLSAAGIRCVLDVQLSLEDPNVRHVFAMAVREATTNILRHSNATTASMRLQSDVDGFSLNISNDGILAIDTPGDATGSGLAGLRGRVVSIGGRLNAGPSGDTFELHVEIPSRTEAT